MTLRRNRNLLGLAFIFLALTVSCGARSAGLCESPFTANYYKTISFEPTAVGQPVTGWKDSAVGTVFWKDSTAHKGYPVVRIEQRPASQSKLSVLATCVRMDFSGKTIVLRGFLKTQNVSTLAGLWLKEGSYSGPLITNSMHDQNLRGTTGWAEYTVALPYEAEGRRLEFGAYLVGAGKVWVSDLQLLVDGKPVWEASKRELPETVLDTDRQFDRGSGISIKRLTDTQIANLVTLGKVWGFLKYYDPEVTAGKWQWDYELFRVLPAVLKARSRAGANDVLLRWVNELGPVAPCNPCAHLDEHDGQLRPDLGWLKDTHRLGKVLSLKLRSIRKNREPDRQFYVALTPGIGNPTFEHERVYSSIDFPDAGFQLLALYRFWNIIEYWYPYRNRIGENWDKVLAEFIPELALAKNRTDYELRLMKLIAIIHDSHANLATQVNIRPPTGSCNLPVHLRFIGAQAVVTGYSDGTEGSSSPFQVGDVIATLDGSPMSILVKKWAPYYGASNQAALLRDVAVSMTDGPCGNATVEIRRDARDLDLVVKRIRPVLANMTTAQGLSGPAFQMLPHGVAYLKLPGVQASQAQDYIKKAGGTEGLIVDLRSGAATFAALPLASMLADKKTPYARFTLADLSDPGAFRWSPPASLIPSQPHYKGKVVVLVDANTQSSGEFAALALRSVPGVVVVGSTTAGADGNVSRVSLPGNVYTMISGVGVFYPDGKPTQRVGIVPNIFVEPAVQDILARRDVALDEALRIIHGKD